MGSPVFSGCARPVGQNNEEQFEGQGVEDSGGWDEGEERGILKQILGIYWVFEGVKALVEDVEAPATGLAGVLSSILKELILRNRGKNERFCVVFGQNMKTILDSGGKNPIRKSRSGGFSGEG